MLHYIIYSAIIWLVLLLFYIFLLRKETFFHYNRLFLLIALSAGVLIPLIPHIAIHDKTVAGTVLNLVIINMQNITVDSGLEHFSNERTGYLKNIIYIVYISVLLIVIFKNLIFILNILKYRKKGHHIKEADYNIIIVNETILTFSFLNTIYISESDYLGKNRDKILMHESIHIKQGHSFDNLFIVLLRIIFWFNPILIQYEKYLKETHEYEADKYVIQHIPKNSYGQLLINQLQSGMQYGIGNYFINSLLKKRIKMMYRKKTTGRWKYIMTFPIIIFLLFFVNACKTSKNTTKNKSINKLEYFKFNEIAKPSNEHEVFTVVEDMPRFPGCEQYKTKAKKQECSMNLLMEYIYKNLKYPEKARKNHISGRVISRFVITSEGKVEDVRILRDIGGDCGKEVKRVIENMNKNNIKWIPGKQGGRRVDVYYTLPVLFRL